VINKVVDDVETAAYETTGAKEEPQWWQRCVGDLVCINSCKYQLYRTFSKHKKVKTSKIFRQKNSTLIVGDFLGTGEKVKNEIDKPCRGYHSQAWSHKTKFNVLFVWTYPSWYNIFLSD
jgi:hypothetical protein